MDLFLAILAAFIIPSGMIVSGCIFGARRADRIWQRYFLSPPPRKAVGPDGLVDVSAQRSAGNGEGRG
jgi:hypothetical protein